MNKADKAVEESKENMDIVIRTLNEQLKEARKKGPEQADLMFVTIAYTLGSLIPSAVEPESYGPMTMRLIEAMGNGIQTGMQMVGAKGSMEMVVRKL